MPNCEFPGKEAPPFRNERDDGGLAIYWLKKDGISIPVHTIVIDRRIVEKPGANGLPECVMETRLANPMGTSRAIELPNASHHEGERGLEIIITEPLPEKGIEIPITSQGQ